MRTVFRTIWLPGCAIAALAGVCFAVSASALDPARTISKYLHDSWRTERGLPGGSITAFAQTSDGYLWIGSDRGLVRFDGLNFHQFEQARPDSIPIGPVRSLLVDASDDLWILLQNTLKSFAISNGNFEPIRGQTEHGTTAMARGKAGAVLLSSSLREPSRLVTTSFEAFRPPLFPPTLRASRAARLLTKEQPPLVGLIVWRRRPPWCSAMAQTDDGKIWLGTERRGLFYLEGDPHFERVE